MRDVALAQARLAGTLQAELTMARITINSLVPVAPEGFVKDELRDLVERIDRALATAKEG